MDIEDILSYLDVPFKFSRQPTPLQPQLRVAWGLSILTLILYVSSRGEKSSVSRLHVINWSLKSKKNYEKIKNILENRRSAFRALVQFDPSLSMALEYAVAENLVEMNEKANVKLTQKGKDLAKDILGTDECLIEEKMMLRELGIAVTEDLAKSILK